MERSVKYIAASSVLQEDEAKVIIGEPLSTPFFAPLSPGLPASSRQLHRELEPPSTLCKSYITTFITVTYERVEIALACGLYS